MKTLCLLVLISLSACTHLKTSGSVQTKVSNTEAHISLSAPNVKMGDRLYLFTKDCEKETLFERTVGCKRVKLGEGRVTGILNKDYAVMQVDPGVQFSEGTIVEKAELTS